MDFGGFLRFNTQREAGRLFEVPRSTFYVESTEHRTPNTEHFLFLTWNMERGTPNAERF